jgi:hypothetical protein
MKAINSCGTVRPNKKIMPSDLGRKLRLKWADVKTSMKGDLARQTKHKDIDEYASFSSRKQCL